MKKRAVINHRPAQILRAGFPVRLAKRQLVRRPIILDNSGMIHRDIRGTLLEVAGRIAADGHHVNQQAIGVGDRGSGCIDKLRLHTPPRFEEASAVGWGECTDMQMLNSGVTLRERGLCVPLATCILHRPRIFRLAELRAQSVGFDLAGRNPDTRANDYDNDGSNNDQSELQCVDR